MCQPQYAGSISPEPGDLQGPENCHPTPTPLQARTDNCSALCLRSNNALTVGADRLAVTAAGALTASTHKQNGAANGKRSDYSSDFYIYSFKILPCPKRQSHDWATCPYAHVGEKACRRDPKVFKYHPTPCLENVQGGCPRGQACPFGHNLYECWLHPTRFRTQFCQKGAGCDRPLCFFAHDADELRFPEALYPDASIGPAMAAAALSGLDATPAGLQTDALGGRVTAPGASPLAASSQSAVAPAPPSPPTVISSGFGATNPLSHIGPTSPLLHSSSSMGYGGLAANGAFGGSSSSSSGIGGSGSGMGGGSSIGMGGSGGHLAVGAGNASLNGSFVGGVNGTVVDELAGALRQLGGLGASGNVAPSSEPPCMHPGQLLQQQQQQQRRPQVRALHLPLHQQQPPLPPAAAAEAAAGSMRPPLASMPLLGQQTQQLQAQPHTSLQAQQLPLARQWDQSGLLLASTAALPPQPLQQMASYAPVHVMQRPLLMLGACTTPEGGPCLYALANGSSAQGMGPVLSTHQQTIHSNGMAHGLTSVQASSPGWLGGHMDPAYSDDSTMPVLTQQALLQAAAQQQVQQQQQQQHWLHAQEPFIGSNMLASGQLGLMNAQSYSP